MKRITFLITLTCLTMAKIHAQTNDDAKYSLARQYYDADITNKAIPLLSELVQKNNVKALNFLGDICYGCYFFDDISKSIRYKEKAANRGYAWAQYELAKSYHTDDKFSDKEKGAFWAGKALLSYKKQAEKGDVNSFLMIGNLYASGWLTEGTNWKEAIKWYEKAANQGNSTAMFKLGNSYWGENLDKAFFYYLNGAKLDNLDCQMQVGTVIYNHGKEHPEWVDGFTLFCTGLFMEDGNGINSWYYKAANEGDAHAEAAIGLGKFNEGNFKEAQKRLLKAKENSIKTILGEKIDVMLGTSSFFLQNSSFIVDTDDDWVKYGGTKNYIFVVVSKKNKKGVAMIDYNGNYINMLIPYLYDRISVKEIENNDEVFFICDDDMGKKYIIDRKGKKEEYIEVCDLLKKYNL